LLKDEKPEALNKDETKLLELFATEINNAKRIEECIILETLFENGVTNYKQLSTKIQEKFNYKPTEATISSAINNINFQFITEKKNKQLKPAGEIYGFKILSVESCEIRFHTQFLNHLKNETFKKYLKDNIEYSILKYSTTFNSQKFNNGFVYYKKYSRKDVFRILNWDKKPVDQNVGGYIVSQDKTNCPIFVNYHKAENISNSTKYEDGFINNVEFEWMTKSNRTKKSSDVQAIMNHRAGLRMPLFIKKSNDEGIEFYYMGDVTPIDSTIKETKMKNDANKQIPVVKMRFLLDRPVETSIYDYITRM
jgi:hypothetical protein